MRSRYQILAWLLASGICTALAADRNVTLPAADIEARLQSSPFVIEGAVAARGIAEDVALKSDVRFDDGLKVRIKIRPAGPGGTEFNNEPRYELAAFLLQQAFLDEPDYVVPPTALRMLPLAVLTPFAPRLRATFRGTEDVLVVLQYWLREVSGPKELWDAARFERDPVYARHIANLNILTHLIRHGDSNAGNIMASTVPESPRVFAVDNGVAFESPSSNRGQAWREIRVPRLPAATVARLRTLDLAALQQRLAVVATWQRRAGHFEPEANAARMPGDKGVRLRSDRVQLGLTRREIQEVDRRRRLLLKRVDRGELGTF
jgi:hypothetical protein